MSQIIADRQQEDLDWATGDPDVQTKYQGQYVVPFDRTIVAHGTDLAAVLRDAEKATGQPAHELPHCAILDPLQDLPK
jgi:hypothetical protein